MRSRILPTLALLVATSLAAWTGPASAQEVDIITLDTDPPTGLSVTGLAPGDTTEWASTVQNVSGRPVTIHGHFGLDDDKHQSPLTLDETFGLQVSIDSCSQPWTPQASPPIGARTFRCEGTESVALDETPLGGTDGRFSTQRVTGADETENLRVTLRFPHEADNDFMRLEGNVKITYTASYDDPPTPVDPPVQPTPAPEMPKTGFDPTSMVAIGTLMVAIGCIFAAARNGTEPQPADEQ